MAVTYPGLIANVDITASDAAKAISGAALWNMNAAGGTLMYIDVACSSQLMFMCVRISESDLSVIC